MVLSVVTWTPQYPIGLWEVRGLLASSVYFSFMPLLPVSLPILPLLPLKTVSWLWIVATSIGMAAGLTAGAALVDYGIGRGDLLLMGAITGLGVGAFQALVLSRSRVSGAFWWALANPPAWALGWLVTSYVITRNVKDQFTNFGASGALVFAMLRWLLLTVLFRNTEPEATQ